MKNKLFKIMIISLLCLAIFAGCAVVPTPDATPEVTPTDDVMVLPELTPIRTPKPEATPQATPSVYNEVLNIHVASQSPSLSKYTKKILLEKFSLNVVEHTDLSEKNVSFAFPNAEDVPESADLVFVWRGGVSSADTVTSTDRVASNVDRSKRYIEFGRAINAINYLDYIDKLPNYTSRFHRKDIYLSQLYENTAMSYPYVVDGELNSLPIIGGYEGEPAGIWMYNTAWFEEYGYELPRDINGLVELLLEHNEIHEKKPLIFSSDAGTYAWPDISSLATAIAQTYGVDLDYFKTQNSSVKKDEENLWMEKIIKMLTLNGEDLELTLNSQNYLNVLEIIKKINDNSLAVAGYPEYNFTKNPVEQYAVAYVPITYSAFTANDAWQSVGNQFTVDEDVVYINTDNEINQNTPINMYIRDNGNAEIIERLIAFLDWSYSDEGIILSVLGENGVSWKYNSEGKIHLVKFTALENWNDYVKGWGGPNSADNSNLDHIAVEDINRLVADKIRDEEFVNGSSKDMTRYYTYHYNRFLTHVDIDNVTFIESLDYTLFEMAHKEGYEEWVYDAVNEIIGIVNNFYFDFISGKKTADDFDSYIQTLDEAGLNTVIQYIENVYDRAYAQYYIPYTLH